jgi:hypothetical protein
MAEARIWEKALQCSASALAQGALQPLDTELLPLASLQPPASSADDCAVACPAICALPARNRIHSGPGIAALKWSPWRTTTC